MLTIGQMAQLNCISVKALLLYEKKGLIEPNFINEETGYRYYSLDQCSRLNAIAQLQAIGFSLSEIHEILESQDLDGLELKLQAKRDELDTEETQLKIRKGILASLTSSLTAVKQKPIYDRIFFESLPDRTVLLFNLQLGEEEISKQPSDEFWENNLSSFRSSLKKEGPISTLFSSCNTGGVIPQERLIKRDFAFEKLFIFTDNDPNELLSSNLPPSCHLATLSGGQYLTCYSEQTINNAGETNYPDEYRKLEQMLEFAKNEGLVVNGDYYDETLAATPLFGFNGRNCLYKLCLPVRRAD